MTTTVTAICGLTRPDASMVHGASGGLEDENKDHFPQMNFRPQVMLEHLA